MGEFGAFLTIIRGPSLGIYSGIRKGGDTSKGVATLAGFGGHPDFGKRALEEVRHAVQVRI